MVNWSVQIIIAPFPPPGLVMGLCSNLGQWIIREVYLGLLENLSSLCGFCLFLPNEQGQNRPIYSSVTGYSCISFMELLQLIYSSKVSLQIQVAPESQKYIGPLLISLSH